MLSVEYTAVCSYITKTFSSPVYYHKHFHISLFLYKVVHFYMNYFIISTV